MWISRQSPSFWQQDVDRVRKSINATRKVHFYDFSQQILDAKNSIGGWTVQQVIKLKMASKVGSDYYMVLDAKNTLLRNVKADTFYSSCHLPKLPDLFPLDHMADIHRVWLSNSASVLNVSLPKDRRYPLSTTPVLLHRQTVLNVLSRLREGPSIEGPICSGGLCPVFQLALRERATEFTLYFAWVYTQPDKTCLYDESESLGRRVKTLWRDEPLKQKTESLDIASNDNNETIMFGAQSGSLDSMDEPMRASASQRIFKIFLRTQLAGGNMTAKALAACVN